MRFEARVALSVLLAGSVVLLACGSKRSGGYSPNNPGNGGTGGGGTGGQSGTGSTGNGGSGNGSGAGGGTNFGGGGPGCDGKKTPFEDACVIHESFAVFVSPKGDDLYGDGSRSKPYKTFDQAISTAALDDKRVYACATAGAFDTQITLDSNSDGVELYGGFDCATWDYEKGTRTQLTGPSSGVIEIADLVTGTRVEDFEITAGAASSPGTASIGVVVGGSKNVHFARLKVTAGAGANGIAGYTTPGVADAGKAGNPGKNACSKDALGGAETVTGCGFPESKGGFGGVAGVGVGSAGSGTDGAPTNLPGGLGGEGQDDTLPGGWSCATVGKGGNGTAGANGDDGEGSTSAGMLSGGGWSSSSGGYGQNGGNGQGGGGGGSLKAPSSCGPTGPNPPIGASGGGGGSGGCGGIGGEGGKGGGASIALTVHESSVTLTDCDLIAKTGGKGGNGGKGQPGGNGAPGAAGGTGACAGGAGAKGGNGGQGGGGAGGPSIGLAFKGEKPTINGGSVQIATAPAAGGADGAGQTVGPGAGGVGLLAKEHEFK